MKTGSKPRGPLYLDTSALAKIYLPEAESQRVDRFLRGRRDLLVSDLAVTEIVSALARRRREGTIPNDVALLLQRAILDDIESTVFRRLDLRPAVFREAERILLSVESVPLRAADSLHLALALSGEARAILTFDARLAEAANIVGLRVVR